MSVQKFSVGSTNSLLAQPDSGGQVYFRSDNAADAGNVTITGVLAAVPSSITEALAGKREKDGGGGGFSEGDPWDSISAVLLSAAQTGVVSVYAWGVAASGFIIVSTQPTNNDTLKIGLTGFQQTYTFKTTLSGTYAIQTVSASGVPANNDTVTIFGTVYTFKTTLTGAVREVHINGQDGSLTNLQSAINASGGTPGTDYGTGTTANIYVTAGAVSSHAITLTAIAIGSGGNSITLAKSGANLAVGGANLAGGGGAVANEVKIGADVSATAANLSAAINGGSGSGVTYGPGTPNNPYVSATASASLLTITDLIACKRQLTWAINQTVGATIGIALPAGGVDGTLLATLAIGVTQSYNAFSLDSEDQVALTLPALVHPTTDAIFVGGKSCTLRFECGTVTSDIHVRYDTSTDGINWAYSLTTIADVNDSMYTLYPQFVHPSEANIEYIRLVFTVNANTTDVALDAAVIF